VAGGLERAGKVMRVPLAEQVVALVQGGGRVALKDVAKRVKGGAKKELDAAIDKLVRAGEARVVVRTQVEVLVSGGDRALSAEEVGEIVKVQAALAKVLKKVTAKGRARSLLREDLAALLGPLAGAAVPAAAPRDAASRAPAADPVDAVVGEALRRLAHPVLGLVRVPDLVRALDGRVPVAEVHRILLAAAEAGTVELRPEAGAEFLGEEDAKLCPPGPRGTVLSYLRLRAP
jgi:hypothetical protein